MELCQEKMTILDGGRSPSVFSPCKSECELDRPRWWQKLRGTWREGGEGRAESGVNAGRAVGVERLGPAHGGHAAIGSPEPPEPNGVGGF